MCFVLAHKFPSQVDSSAPWHGAITCKPRHTERRQDQARTWLRVLWSFLCLSSCPMVGTSEVRWRVFPSLCALLADRPLLKLVLVWSCLSTVLAPCPFRTRRSFVLSREYQVMVSWLRVLRYEPNGMHFVTSVDLDPKSLHDVTFYATVARTLAEVMGSAQPADYAEPHMRSLIVDNIKVGAAPFDRESEAGVWKSVRIQPAHITLCAPRASKSCGTICSTVFFRYPW